MNTQNEVSLKALQISLWDFYKAVHGVRPRHLDMSSRDDVLLAFKRLHQFIEAQTPEWRDAHGWK